MVCFVKRLTTLFDSSLLHFTSLSFCCFYFILFFICLITEQANDHHSRVPAVEKAIQQLIRCHHRLRKVVKYPHHQGKYEYSSFFICFIVYFGCFSFLLLSAISRAPFLNPFFSCLSEFLFVFALFCTAFGYCLFVRDHDTNSIDCVHNFALFGFYKNPNIHKIRVVQQSFRVLKEAFQHIFIKKHSFPYRYRVVLFGDAGTGKTALVSQFMTSEYMHTYDASLGKFKRNSLLFLLLLLLTDHFSVDCFFLLCFCFVVDIVKCII